MSLVPLAPYQLSQGHWLCSLGCTLHPRDCLSLPGCTSSPSTFPPALAHIHLTMRELRPIDLFPVPGGSWQEMINRTKAMPAPPAQCSAKRWLVWTSWPLSFPIVFYQEIHWKSRNAKTQSCLLMNKEVVSLSVKHLCLTFQVHWPGCRKLWMGHAPTLVTCETFCWDPL